MGHGVTLKQMSLIWEVCLRDKMNGQEGRWALDGERYILEMDEMGRVVGTLGEQHRTH